MDCSEVDCTARSVSRGLCKHHYYKRHRAGTLPPKANKESKCIVEGCERAPRAQKRCNKHYEVYRVYGKDKSDRELSSIEYFLLKGWTVTDSGCWEYNGSRNEFGYGIIRRQRAHRISYEHFIGPIPDSLVIRHTCDNPSCVNWEHLIPGVQAENVQDMYDRGRAYNSKYTSCPKGHEYTPENDLGYGNKSGRCKICNDARKRRYENRKKNLKDYK
jgi:hypothetical protein